MKAHPSIAAAQALADAKSAELEAAKEVVTRLERERAEAMQAVRQAREAVDATLPQCRLVRVRWRSGSEAEDGRAVIVRQTKGGMLVARRVGAAADQEIKFKWREHSTKFVEDKKRSSFTTDQLELRDVPEEYLVAAKTTAAAAG